MTAGIVSRETVPALAPADLALWEALGEATPAFTTWPTPGAPHDLEGCRLVARVLGTPLMPWQEWAIRILTERRLDDPNRYRYTIFLLTVPRQCGKTTVLRVLLTHRAITNDRRRAFYTAQTGKDAAARWKDLVEALLEGPLGGHVQLRKAIGSQAVTFPNGSSIAPFAPTPKSLHGYTPHDVMVDEIFAFDEAQGDELLGAAGPAQLTLPDRQLGLVSTAGNAASTFLRKQRDAGIAAIGDPHSVMAMIEHSQPEELDPHDPNHWGFHPALGHTATIEDLVGLHAQHESTPFEWVRGFMNRWTTTSEAVIPADELERCFTEQSPPANLRDMALAYEVAFDRSRSVIWAAWEDPVSGRPALRLVRSGAGTGWLPAAVLELVERWRPRLTGADDAGPTRDATDEIRKLAPHVELEIMGPRDFATACDSIRAKIAGAEISIERAAGMIESAAAVTTRSMGQGYAWDRVKSSGPIPDLVAGTVALRLLEHGTPVKPDPVIRFS